MEAVNNWVRGTCHMGMMPANGLQYAPPHPCQCYIDEKLNGLNAVAAADTAEPFVSPQGRSNSTVATRAASARSLDRYLLRHYQATGAGNARTFSGFVPVLVAQPVVEAVRVLS